MKYIKSDTLTANASVKHGFIYSENPINLKDLSKEMDLEIIKTVKQVHSNKYIHIKDEADYEKNYEADAIISNLKGRGAGVYTADCVPIIIADIYSGYYGVIHAGWKGTLAGISEKVSEYMINELECKSENIKTVIGPCIEGGCYEIGEEIAVQFQERFINSNLFLTKIEGTKYKLDLKKANVEQLTGKGITGIDVMDICTKCDSDYPSYRRDGKNAGRMLSFVGFV